MLKTHVCRRFIPTSVDLKRFVCVVPQLIYGGKLDFLVFDYLSEITMSLLTAAKTKMPVSVCPPPDSLVPDKT